jgi:predicted nucleic-acid-binding protein
VKVRRPVDTNLVVRHLVQDHKEHAKKAELLFTACDRGELTLVVLSSVLAECVFVLESFYKHSRRDIAEALTGLLTSAGVEHGPLSVSLDALARYAGSRAHFVDCVVASNSVAEGIAVATFDKDFKKFKDVDVKVDL